MIPRYLHCEPDLVADFPRAGFAFEVCVSDFVVAAAQRAEDRARVSGVRRYNPVALNHRRDDCRAGKFKSEPLVSQVSVIFDKSFCEDSLELLAVLQQVARDSLHNLRLELGELCRLLVLALALLPQTATGTALKPITQLFMIGAAPIVTLLPLVEGITGIFHVVR